MSRRTRIRIAKIALFAAAGLQGIQLYLIHEIDSAGQALVPTSSVASVEAPIAFELRFAGMLALPARTAVPTTVPPTPTKDRSVVQDHQFDRSRRDVDGAHDPDRRFDRSNSSPWIYIEGIGPSGSVLDIGEISSSQPFESDFTLTNRGWGELSIRDFMDGNPALKTAIGNSEIAPGESTTLRLTFDPRFQTQRRVDTRFRFASNDPVHPLVEYTLRATLADP